jgi:thioredoxin 1
MKEINKDNFDEILKISHQLVVKFEADWCAPCRAIAPILEDLSTENKNIEFVKCNIDENPELANRFSIRNIPTIMYFKEGQLLEIQVGLGPKTTFAKKLNQLYERV